MTTSGMRTHLLKKCALVLNEAGAGEVKKVQYDGKPLLVGTVTYLMYQRSTFAWKTDDREVENAKRSGIFVEVLVALKKSGALVSAAVLVSQFHRPKQSTSYDFGECLEMITRNNKDMVVSNQGIKVEDISAGTLDDFLCNLKLQITRDKLSDSTPLLPRIAEALKDVSGMFESEEQQLVEEPQQVVHVRVLDEETSELEERREKRLLSEEKEMMVMSACR